VSYANVSKIDINFSMLQTLISTLHMPSFDVADAYCWVLQILNLMLRMLSFNVAHM
jgi:hypothetical protein